MKSDDLQPAFTVWWKTYLTRFPSPARQPPMPNPESTRMAGLEPVGEAECFDYHEPFTVEGLAGYLATQSNAQDHLQRSGGDPEDWIQALAAELTPFFPTPDRRFQFQGRLAVWRRG